MNDVHRDYDDDPRDADTDVRDAVESDADKEVSDTAYDAWRASQRKIHFDAEEDTVLFLRNCKNEKSSDSSSDNCDNNFESRDAVRMSDEDEKTNRRRQTDDADTDAFHMRGMLLSDDDELHGRMHSSS